MVKRKTNKTIKENSMCGSIFGGYSSNGSKKDVFLSEKDRFNHFYMVGQTGTGKSTMVLQQAISDINKGYGICLFDTYGDLSEKILQYYPKERVDDLIYFDLSNKTYPIGLNPFDGTKTDEERDLLTNNIVDMFIDMYGDNIFGPRIQDYFRNACLLLSGQPHPGTFLEIMRLFSDEAFAQSQIENINNPTIDFRWHKIYPKIGDREKQEIIPFIQAKLSPFTTSKYINLVLGQFRSAFTFEDIIKEKKVIICKFPKGIVGERNAAIMCRILLMQLQQAILNRINIPEKDRSPFFVYMDDFNQYMPNKFGEFLNDSTKYNVGVIMTNQYIDQLKIGDKDISKVVLNNVGTILAFRMGNLDADYLEKYFSPDLSIDELKNLGKFKGALKICSNGIQLKPLIINTTINIEKNIVNTKKKVEILKKISALRRGTKRSLVDKELRFVLGV